MIILAVESSCDETSVAILKDNTILSNIVLSQIDIHTLYGGVVPEIASRNHAKYILPCFIEAIKKTNIEIKDIDYVAITNGPGLIGSLLVGVVAALSFAWIHNIKVIPINHLIGHIFASSIDSTITYPAICLLVSGGHTDLLYLENETKYRVLGVTMDDAVGETYDKVARILGLGYPGGPIIDKLAKEGNKTIKFPLPKVDKKYHFSFSGLKSSVLYQYEKDIKNNKPININDYCASFQEVVIKSLANKTFEAVKDYNVKTLIVAGGVSANRGLREALKERFKNINLLIPKISLCTDNAAMIASAAFNIIKNIKIKEGYIIQTYSTNRFDDIK